MFTLIKGYYHSDINQSISNLFKRLFSSEHSINSFYGLTNFNNLDSQPVELSSNDGSIPMIVDEEDNDNETNNGENTNNCANMDVNCDTNEDTHGDTNSDTNRDSHGHTNSDTMNDPNVVDNNTMSGVCLVFPPLFWHSSICNFIIFYGNSPTYNGVILYNT